MKKKHVGYWLIYIVVITFLLYFFMFNKTPSIQQNITSQYFLIIGKDPDQLQNHIDLGELPTDYSITFVKISDKKRKKSIFTDKCLRTKNFTSKEIKHCIEASGINKDNIVYVLSENPEITKDLNQAYNLNTTAQDTAEAYIKKACKKVDDRGQVVMVDLLLKDKKVIFSDIKTRKEQIEKGINYITAIELKDENLQQQLKDKTQKLIEDANYTGFGLTLYYSVNNGTIDLIKAEAFSTLHKNEEIKLALDLDISETINEKRHKAYILFNPLHAYESKNNDITCSIKLEKVEEYMQGKKTVLHYATLGNTWLDLIPATQNQIPGDSYLVYILLNKDEEQLQKDMEALCGIMPITNERNAKETHFLTHPDPEKAAWLQLIDNTLQTTMEPETEKGLEDKETSSKKHTLHQLLKENPDNVIEACMLLGLVLFLGSFGLYVVLCLFQT